MSGHDLMMYISIACHYCTGSLIAESSRSNAYSFELLLGFPSDFADPNCPLLNIVSFQQKLDAIPLLSQFFVCCKAMYEAVTRSTKPSNLVQLPASMPATFDNLCMHSSWDQMMIGEWQMFPLADLTLGGPTGWCKLWRCIGSTRDVGREHRFQ